MKIHCGEQDININFGIPGGLVTILAVLFIVLKALGYLDWSWLWVLSPIWIAASLIGVILLGIFVFVRKVVKKMEEF